MNIYKTCAVPLCKNTSTKCPNKLFIRVPHNKTIRNKWLILARRDHASVNVNMLMYFCEDHFDLPNDMENYLQYRLRGSVSKISMKPLCLPKKFECQPQRNRRIRIQSHIFQNKCNQQRMIKNKEIKKNTEYSSPITECVSILNSAGSTDTTLNPSRDETDCLVKPIEMTETEEFQNVISQHSGYNQRNKLTLGKKYRDLLDIHEHIVKVNSAYIHKDVKIKIETQNDIYNIKTEGYLKDLLEIQETNLVINPKNRVVLSKDNSVNVKDTTNISLSTISPAEASTVLKEAKFTKYQYLLIKNLVNNKTASHVFPSYDSVLAIT